MIDVENIRNDWDYYIDWKMNQSLNRVGFIIMQNCEKRSRVEQVGPDSSCYPTKLVDLSIYLFNSYLYLDILLWSTR